ncbi:uncharacterized protein LOC128230691 [Mya arenaria]|uniref:uncharacterized protein LOC128230691 n=1 Tax=Mya arenaria TaxID=6604 RepID=UPI0022E4746A|nr:uncharacterized protein LOC128230691 [Mya arenaria]
MLNVITTPPTTLDLERFWKLESIGITPEGDDTSGSRNLKTYMESNISYDEGRYIAKLPWKDDHLPLPTNFDISVRRTENLIKRLQKEPFMLQKYGEIIREQRDRGFIEEVDTNVKNDHPIHCIPHHGVKKDSVTTPVRIVYDCSCRQSADKPSLNDCLQSTPPELNDLAGILMRFRLNRYAITSDIEKAFLHVSLDEKDRDVTRFLWLSDPSDPDSPLTTYRFKAVLFGATCSPFILCATIIKHLENNSGNWVSNHLLRDIYVDNIISSFSQERDVVDFFRDTRALMSAANFNLRSWNSNSSIVREMAKVDHVLDNDGASKVLRMRWDAVKGTISFPERLIPVADIVTKRTILQHTSMMYDPLGLLIPVTIRAKIILQELWEKKYAWDSPLPHELQQKWQEIARDMNSASSSSFNRCLFNFEADDNVNAADETILHVLSDASMTSYGATVYICRVNQSALVMAKSRVAPLKKLTLPRLELMAAVIGARLGRHVQQQLNISKMELWSDSQITLHWLQSMKSLPRFVRNRVEEIHQLTDIRKWRYCPTKENPADLLTRGISAVQFSDNTLWFKGPQWIDETDKWPTWDYQSTTVCITGTDHCDEPEPQSSSESSRNTIAGIHTIIDVTRYSSLGKLLRVTAYVLRFAQNCRLEVSARRLEHLTASELKETEELWLRSCQVF